MTNSEQKHVTKSLTYQVVTAAFGVLFTFIAIVILVISKLTVGPVVAALVIGILGIDAIVSAYRKTTSLLSRIGPLP